MAATIGAILGGVGGLAGGLGSIFGGGGGSSQPSFNNLNPMLDYIAALFGGYIGTENNMPAFERIRPGSQGTHSYDARFPGSIFAGTQGSVADLLNPLPYNIFENMGRDLAYYAASGGLPPRATANNQGTAAAQPQAQQVQPREATPAPVAASNPLLTPVPKSIGRGVRGAITLGRSPVNSPRPAVTQPTGTTVPVAPPPAATPPSAAAPPPAAAPPAAAPADPFAESGLGNAPEGSLDRIMETVGFFEDFLMPTVQELVETGFRTDMQPIIDAANRRFERETVPDLTERFLGQTGTFSSDFLNSVTNAGRDMQIYLGALQPELDEAAAQRRAAGIPLAGQLGITTQNLPLGFASELNNLGSLFRAQDEAMRPGGRVLDLLAALGGMQSPFGMGIVGQGGFPSGTSSMAAALGQAAPGFVSAAGQLGQGLAGLFGNKTPDSFDLAPFGISIPWPGGG